MRPGFRALALYVDALSRLPSGTYDDYRDAVSRDPDVHAAIMAADVTALANAILAVAYRVYGHEPPERVALSFRWLGLMRRRRRRP